MAFQDDLKSAFSGSLHLGVDRFWETDLLPTGIPPLDYSLGGGFGYGRLAELYGGWSAGKTMVLYYTLASNQKKGGVSILFEAEGAFTPEFFEACGGNPEALFVYTVDTVEQVFDGMLNVCDTVLKEGKRDRADKPKVCIGWDGIAATATKHLLDTGMETRDMTKAGLMTFGTQLITTKAKESGVCIIATNQTREKIGSMDSSTHTPGGKAWPFHSSQRLELSFDGGTKTSLIFSRDGQTEIGRWVKGQVTKNKLASPFGKFPLPIYIRDNFWHPDYEYGIKIGIDLLESLFYFYLHGPYRLKSGNPVLTSPSSGWYKLDDSIAPGDAAFRKKEWPAAVSKYQEVWSLLYAVGKPVEKSTS